MKIEFEAKIIKINKNIIRDKLKTLGAELCFKEKLFTRITFDNPELRSKNTWVRLRDESGKVTLALKSVKNEDLVYGSSDGIYKNFYDINILIKPELVF
ncbi:MAG: hypothetical protein WC988_04115 [Patescibacteria group bacterium]